MNNTMLKAKVVAYTQAVDSSLTDANELIAYIARVSNPSNQHNNLSAPKLINYLQNHKHWSPFEHYSLTIEIECPKDIAVQILRHRSFRFQEFSQRYADVTQMGLRLVSVDYRTLRTVRTVLILITTHGTKKEPQQFGVVCKLSYWSWHKKTIQPL